MKKRGQVTIFIILGIIIVLAVGILLYISHKSAAIHKQEQADSSEVEAMIRVCSEQATMEALRQAGLHGGYVNPRGDPTIQEVGDGRAIEARYFFEDTAVSYAYMNRKGQLPSIQELSTVTSNFVRRSLGGCVNLSFYARKDYSVVAPSHSAQNVKVTILKEEVLVEVVYPVELRKDSTTFTVPTVSGRVKTRFGLLYDKANHLLMQDLADYSLANHCAEYASPDKKVNVYVRSNRQNNDQLIQFIDASPLERGGKVLKFQFATRNTQIKGECVG